MALYTLAWRAAHPEEPVRAAVMGQIRRGDVKAVGIYADEGARFMPPGKDDREVRAWADLAQRWDALMRGLAEAFARGEAAVAPRDAGVCRYCARQSLCRVGSAVATDEETDE